MRFLVLAGGADELEAVGPLFVVGEAGGGEDIVAAAVGAHVPRLFLYNSLRSPV